MSEEFLRINAIGYELLGHEKHIDDDYMIICSIITTTNCSLHKFEHNLVNFYGYN